MTALKWGVSPCWNGGGGAAWNTTLPAASSNTSHKRRPPRLISVADREVLQPAPSPAERGLALALPPFPCVEDAARLGGLAGRDVVRSELLVGPRLAALRVPGEPAEPVAGRKLWFERLVGQPAEAQGRGAARGVVDQHSDPGVAEVHGALEGFGRKEGDLARLHGLGIHGHVRRVDQVYPLEIERASDPGPGQSHLPDDRH